MNTKIIKEQSGRLTVELHGKKFKGLTVEEALRAVDAAYVEDITETIKQVEIYRRVIASGMAQAENAMKGLEAVLEDFKRRHDPATAEAVQGDAEMGAVMTAYMNTLGPFLSPEAVAALKAYISTLGKEVLLHALTVARDAGKTNWAYIRAILREWSRQGVTCMGDVQRLEEAKKAGKYQVPARKGSAYAARMANPGDGTVKDLAALERLIERI